LWRRAINIWRSGPPPTVHGLLHRDFHLGNVLWNGDTVTGLIDWAETSWGPADLDVAHLCADFAMLHATADAETFRTGYLQQGGQLDPNPDAARFWFVSDILGFLPDPAHIIPAVSSNRPDLTPDDVRRGLEDLLAHLLVRERAGGLEQSVGERRLAVVDVRDDAEISDSFLGKRHACYFFDRSSVKPMVR
jgi:hypothetical protein